MILRRTWTLRRLKSSPYLLQTMILLKSCWTTSWTVSNLALNYNLSAWLVWHVIISFSCTESGEIIKSGLGRRSGLDALKNLTDILDTIKNVRQSLESVENSSRRLKVQAKQLEVGLTERKRKLLELLRLCNSPKCEELKNTSEIRSLRVENDFRQVSSRLRNFTTPKYEVMNAVNEWD